MTQTCKITLKCTLKFKILQSIQCTVEAENNDVCVRDVVIQMQMVPFKIGEKSARLLISFPSNGSVLSELSEHEHSI